MSEYLNHFRDIENVYYLNKAGRELVGSYKEVAKTAQYVHTIMRNDIYIHFDCPNKWVTEFPIVFGKEKIRTDAVFQVGEQQYFLEVDHLQKMRVNLHKLEAYRRFKDTGKWQENNGQFPIILFYTTTAIRKEQLLQHSNGLTLQILTKEDLL